MKKCALLSVMFLSGNIAFAQSDPTLLAVNGQPVSRSEFEYYYNKVNTVGGKNASNVSLADELDKFVAYKLKVQAALEMRMDTLDAFKREYAAYCVQDESPVWTSFSDGEPEVRKIYDDKKKYVQAKGGMVRPAHILIRLRQNASSFEERRAKTRIDSIYAALQGGASFETLAEKCSADKGSAANGGLLPWIEKRQTVKAFEDIAFSLEVGQVSKPFLSEFGYHIVKLVGKQDFFPYDSLKSDLYDYVDAKRIRERIENDSLQLTGSLMPVASPVMTPLQREFYEGLLLHYVSNAMAWRKAEQDERALKTFYAEHKKDYGWTNRRFRGIAFYAKSKADAKAVKRLLKRIPMEKWMETIGKTFNNGKEKRIWVETVGLFAMGENALVDNKVFKMGNTLPVRSGFPIAVAYGKVLKKGPESYVDVKPLVMADYQERLEDKWLETLRNKYPVVIDKQVLATVNKH